MGASECWCGDSDRIVHTKIRTQEKIVAQWDRHSSGKRIFVTWLDYMKLSPALGSVACRESSIAKPACLSKSALGLSKCEGDFPKPGLISFSPIKNWIWFARHPLKRGNASNGRL